MGNKTMLNSYRKALPENWDKRINTTLMASQVALVVKNPHANAGDIKDVVLIPREESPGGGHYYPVQYSYLENFMDRGD